MGKNRIEMRRQAEAAEALEKGGAAPTKPARASRAKSADKADKEVKTGEKKKKAVRKTREKTKERRRAIWVIYSGTMREEGRYPYWEKAAAEERLEMLRSRGKRLYFMQMVKELIVGDGQVQTIVPQLEEEEGLEAAQVAVAAPAEEAEEGLSIEIDDGDFAATEEEVEEEEEEEEEAEEDDE